MAKVLIDSGPITAGLRLHEVPRQKWRDLMLARRAFLQISLSHDCRCLVEFCNDANQMFAECGFDSAEQMIRDGYGLEPEEIAVAVEWLKLNPPAEPIALEQAVILGKRGAPVGNQNAAKNKDDNINIVSKPKTKGGTSKEYILARLDRDGHAELAAKVRADEMSANAAAVEAGFRKQATPFERILKLLPKLTPTERRQLRARLDEMRKPKAA